MQQETKQKNRFFNCCKELIFMGLLKKPKVIFYFGEHAGKIYNIPYGPDKKFFSQIGERTKESKGRKQIIVPEIFTEIESGERESAISKIRENAEDFNLLVKEQFTKRINRGQEPLEFGEWFDWGYLEEVRKQNEHRAATVEVCPERISCLANWIPKFGVVKRNIITGLKISAVICYQRDLVVAEQIKRIISERGAEVDIYVPRGFAHIEMVRFFDKNEIEIEVNERMRGAPKPSTDIIREFYRGEVNLERWREAAQIQSRYYEELERLVSKYLQISMDGNNFDEEKFRKISTEAKERAIENYKKTRAESKLGRSD